MMKRKRMTGALVALVIAVGGFGAYSFLVKDQVASIVLLDVNPSIELRVDSDEEILEANALNTDAEKVLKGMKLKGTDVDTAVNAIVGSLLKNGYIDELANSILVSVEDKDAARGEKLQQELSEEINQILGATAINAAVLSQYMNGETTAELADELNISKGKAELIQNIASANETYKVNELAKLSVNELNLVLSNSKNEKVDVVSKGTASENAYIGNEKAKEIAFTHAGVSAQDVRELEIEIDYEYGKMVYEVEFGAAEYEYDYSIGAVKGDVLHSHREFDDDYVPVKDNTTKPEEAKPEENKVTDIGEAKAKEIALKHAGLKESEVKGLRVERDRDDGRVEYKVEFYVGNKEYDYEILAETGKILDYDVDVEDDKKVNVNTNTNTTKPEENKVTDIGEAKAKEVALKHAGLKESEVKALRVEREKDDGRVEYKVEFYVGNKEYDYEISAETGKILDYDVDVEDDKKVSANTNTNTNTNTDKNTTKPAEEKLTDIGKENAKCIALKHAGLSESQVTRLKVERDMDDGKIEYGVEFHANGKEYDYEISGASGKITDYDIETEDDD